MEGLEIFGENDLRHELLSGLTEGVQEVVGLETPSPQGQQPPGSRLASSYLVEKQHGKDLHSAHNEQQGGLFWAGTENRAVLPQNLVDSLCKYHSKGQFYRRTVQQKNKQKICQG